MSLCLHCQNLRTLGILGSEVAEVEFQADQNRTLGSEVESQVEFAGSGEAGGEAGGITISIVNLIAGGSLA